MHVVRMHNDCHMNHNRTGQMERWHNVVQHELFNKRKINSKIKIDSLIKIR